MKFKNNFKKCPRCKNKCLLSQKKCDECGLVFARLDEATNKNAKKQFFNKEKSIVYVTQPPKDVNKWVLLILCAFLGPFGAHNFYVGRYYKAIYMLFFGLLSLVYVSFKYPTQFMLDLMSSFPIVACVGVLAILWVVDFVQIVFSKYKIPVALNIGSGK